MFFNIYFQMIHENLRMFPRKFTYEETSYEY